MNHKEKKSYRQLNIDSGNIRSVSVVMCTYNGEKYLSYQLDSILSQTYPIFELIVQDDNSTDGTKKIINDYAGRYPLIKPYFNEENLGFKKNFSSAVSKATGDFIALSDQDDIWLGNHIEVLVNLIGNKPLACANSLYIDSNGHDLNCTLNPKKQMNDVYKEETDFAYRIFYNSSIFPGHNMILTASFAKSSLPIPDNIEFHDIWFSALACCQGGINYSSDVICLYRRHQNTVTSFIKHAVLKELLMTHHYDFGKNKITLYQELVKRTDLSNNALNFLDEFRQYAIRCPHFKYKLWCWKWRFSHYKKIYFTTNYRYFLLRSIQYLLTPTVTKVSDVSKLTEVIKHN